MLPVALLLGVIAADDMLTRLATMPKRPNGSQVSALLVGSSGIDASETLVREPTADRLAGAISLRSSTLAYSFDQGVIVRVVNEAELGIGGGNQGVMFQGALLLSLMGGYRVSVTKNQGPFIRAGILGLVAGNALFYRSALVLPDAHIGYQYLLTRKVLVEAAYTTGLVLTGRSDAAGGSHDLDLALGVGTMLTIDILPFSLSTHWTHMLPTNSPSPVDWFEGSLCVEPGQTLAMCMRGSWDHTIVTLPDMTTRSVTINQVGITLGNQQRKRLHKAGLY